MNENHVILGFSGGLDSVRSAELLRDKGYEVIAVTIDTDGDEQMIEFAKAKAKELSLRHIIEDSRTLFSDKIIDNFVSEYNLGRTPAPCTLCNSEIKWKILLEVANREMIFNIATGHYFQIEKRGNTRYVTRAKDLIKDQSYYLWGLTQEILERAITPMADTIKCEFMSALPAKNRTKESMGVCFLKGMSCSDYLKKKIGKQIHEGEVVDKNGKVIGVHSGFQLYTIGQKKGVNASTSGCIIGIDSAKNQLLWGEKQDLNYLNLELTDWNIQNLGDLNQSITVIIRGYGLNPILPAKSITHDNNKIHIELQDYAWAPSLGQPVVLYHDNLVIGGGILNKYY